MSKQKNYLEVEEIKTYQPAKVGSILVMIDNDVWCEMKKVGKEFRSGKRSGYPWCGLIGKDAFGHIRKVIHINRDNTGGCVQMPNLSIDMLSNAATDMAMEGLSLAGVVRIGNFESSGDTAHEGTRGPSLKEFSRLAPNFYIISLALNGLYVETWDVEASKERGRYGSVKKIHGYKITNRIKGGSHGYEEIQEIDDAEADRRKAESEQGQESGEEKPAESPEERPGKEHDSAEGEKRRGHVRKARGSAPEGEAERGNDSGRVPEPQRGSVRSERQGEQEAGGEELHPAGRGRGNEDGESRRREITDADFEVFKARLFGNQELAEVMSAELNVQYHPSAEEVENE